MFIIASNGWESDLWGGLFTPEVIFPHLGQTTPEVGWSTEVGWSHLERNCHLSPNMLLLS